MLPDLIHLIQREDRDSQQKWGRLSAVDGATEAVASDKPIMYQKL
jgi:hypothetical protein